MPAATPAPVAEPVTDVLPQVATDYIGVAKLRVENDFLRQETRREDVLERRLATEFWCVNTNDYLDDSNRLKTVGFRAGLLLYFHSKKKRDYNTTIC